MVTVVQSNLVERVVEDLPFGTVVVVCDADGDAAASVAGRVTGFRTAVLVGELGTDHGREVAELFCREMFASDADEIRLISES